MYALRMSVINKEATYLLTYLLTSDAEPTLDYRQQMLAMFIWHRRAAHTA